MIGLQPDALPCEAHGFVERRFPDVEKLHRQVVDVTTHYLNAGGQSIIRLLTPRGMKYEEAYARAHPFNELKEDLLDPRMIQETVDLMKKAIQQKARINVIVNNRAGGNAPIISQRIGEEFLSSQTN